MAIRVNGLRSRWWRVRAAVKRPELFIEREGLERHVHVSLHESGRWHLKVSDEARHTWLRPDEYTPGYTRAVAVIQPVAVACLALPPLPGTRVFAFEADDVNAAQFNVVIERPGANQLSWPARRASSTEFVARLPLAAGAGTCCVMLHREPLEPGSLALPQPDEAELEQLREGTARGDAYATIVGHAADGALVLIDLRAGPSQGVS